MLTRLVNWNFNKFSHRSGGLIGFRLNVVFHSSGLSGSRSNVVFRSSGLNGLSDSRLNVFRSDGFNESISADLYNFHSLSIPTNDVLKG
jgi:hypothetical protein